MKNKYMITMINSDFIITELTQQEFLDITHRCSNLSSIRIYDINNKLHFINTRHIVQIYECDIS